MTSINNSLQSGGYEPDTSLDIGSDFDLWWEETAAKAKSMSTEELEAKSTKASFDGDLARAAIYDMELAKRHKPEIPCPEPEEFQDDPEHEDRWDEYKENYMAEDEGYAAPCDPYE